MADHQNITPFSDMHLAERIAREVSRQRQPLRELLTPRPRMTDRDALRLVVRNGDVLDVDGGCWLLVAMPEELADHLACLDAETADLEPDDIMRADGSEILTGDGLAGDADDSEEDDPTERNGDEGDHDWAVDEPPPGTGQKFLTFGYVPPDRFGPWLETPIPGVAFNPSRAEVVRLPAAGKQRTPTAGAIRRVGGQAQ